MIKLNWFKKLFTNNEDEDTEEEIKMEDKSVFSRKSKSPFRFPLISDEEKIIKKEDIFTEEPIIESYKLPDRKPARDLYKGKTRELREPRSIRDPRESFDETYKVPYIEKKSKEEPPIKPLHKQELWLQRKQQKIVHPMTPIKDIVEKTAVIKVKKAFTPTQVPSPVYGFSREEKRRKEEQKLKNEQMDEIAVTETEILVPIVPVKEAEPEVIEVSTELVIKKEPTVENVQSIAEFTMIEEIEEIEEKK